MSYCLLIRGGGQGPISLIQIFNFFSSVTDNRWDRTRFKFLARFPLPCIEKLFVPFLKLHLSLQFSSALCSAYFHSSPFADRSGIGLDSMLAPFPPVKKHCLPSIHCLLSMTDERSVVWLCGRLCQTQNRTAE